jgi:co-chaperonin GroES (HSP10)
MSELNRSQLGNASDEQGAFMNGSDTEALNHSQMPSGRQEPIEVDAAIDETGIVLSPKELYEKYPLYTIRRGDLEEGPMDVLMATLTEEPDATGLAVRRVAGADAITGKKRLSEITRANRNEHLVWYGSHPDYYQAMLGDRILIRKDTLELEDACKKCHGKGYFEDTDCELCHGTQFETGPDDSRSPCRACKAMGYGMEGWWSCGKRLCEGCRASGWRAGVIIPESAQTEAITGIIVSVGPDTKISCIGDRVIHSKFAGHSLKVAKNETFVMMRECEVLSILKQRTHGTAKTQ